MSQCQYVIICVKRADNVMLRPEVKLRPGYRLKPTFHAPPRRAARALPLPDYCQPGRRVLEAPRASGGVSTGMLRMGLTIPASNAAARMLLNSPLATRAAMSGWSRLMRAARRSLLLPFCKGVHCSPFPSSALGLPVGFSSGAFAIVSAARSIAESDCSRRTAACCGSCRASGGGGCLGPSWGPGNRAV